VGAAGVVVALAVVGAVGAGPPLTMHCGAGQASAPWFWHQLA
jgi:hypothetical protein